MSSNLHSAGFVAIPTRRRSTRKPLLLRHVLGAALLLSGCVPLPISARVNVVTVTGIIVEQDSHKPIPHARVEVVVRCEQPENLVAYTNQDGQFDLKTAGSHSGWIKVPLLPPFPGEHGWHSSIEVRVNAHGYEPFSYSDTLKGMMLSTRPDYCRGTYELGELELASTGKGR